MTPIFELISIANRVDATVQDTCDLISCEIEMDNGAWVQPYEWQKTMINDIIQSCIRGDKDEPMMLCDNRYHHGFSYNIIYYCGDVFLINVDTGRTRRMRYTTSSIEEIEN